MHKTYLNNSIATFAFVKNLTIDYFIKMADGRYDFDRNTKLSVIVITLITFVPNEST